MQLWHHGWICSNWDLILHIPFGFLITGEVYPLNLGALHPTTLSNNKEICKEISPLCPRISPIISQTLSCWFCARICLIISLSLSGWFGPFWVAFTSVPKNLSYIFFVPFWAAQQVWDFQHPPLLWSRFVWGFISLEPQESSEWLLVWATNPPSFQCWQWTCESPFGCTHTWDLGVCLHF